MTNANWTERNALVDAVHAAGDKCHKAPHGWGYDTTDANYPAYVAALDALKTYDAARGGAPVL